MSQCTQQINGQWCSLGCYAQGRGKSEDQEQTFKTMSRTEDQTFKAKARTKVWDLSLRKTKDQEHCDWTAPRQQEQLLIIRRTRWWSWLLQVSQLCQAIHLCHLVPEAPQKMPSAHWGDHGPELSWTDQGQGQHHCQRMHQWHVVRCYDKSRAASWSRILQRRKIMSAALGKNNDTNN